MSEEILVNITPQETRVALVENGVLQEVVIERLAKRGLVGNIYLGSVSRVLPGMQAAFIDIGIDRTAFLHVLDIAGHKNQNNNAEVSESEPAIEHILREGQNVLVQVTKDPLGSKGARLTTNLSIPSRYLVLLPDEETVGVSQRIEDIEERERLREVIISCKKEIDETDQKQGVSTESYGLILRTAAEGVEEKQVSADIKFLKRLWHSIKNQTSGSDAPEIIYEDLPMLLRMVRSLDDSSIEKIRIDSKETYDKVASFTNEFVPDLVPKIEHYVGGRPIMDLYAIEDELQKALERKVNLKSGGHLVIDQTEAMTTIDVNTGTFVGNRNLEETIFKTNLESAQALSRQLRLRNLGGIIIVDFIDMKDPEHQRQVLRALEKSLSHDHSKVAISEITSLGLVQITRKRTRESLEHILCEPCPICKGSGSIKTTETICYEIFREILREARQFEARKLLVVAAQDVVDRLLDEESNGVAELEEFIKIPIKFQAEPMYAQEQYDIVLL
ncbi:MAG: ribonuclease G [Gammaproteobacteria bacterium]